MMDFDSHEYRMGNWVYDLAQTPVQIIRLKANSVVIERPIPLTEDWLLRMGFTVADKPLGIYTIPFGSHALQKLVVCRYGIGGRNWCSGLADYYTGEERSENFPYAPVEYVHQVQNLFFALCGKEIKVNTTALTVIS